MPTLKIAVLIALLLSIASPASAQIALSDVTGAIGKVRNLAEAGGALANGDLEGAQQKLDGAISGPEEVAARALQQIVTNTRDMLTTARDASEAVKSTIYLFQNPDDVVNSARSDFLTSFTELDAINRDAAALHASLTTSPTGFDPSAYQRAMDSGIRSGTSFQTFLAFREKDYGTLGYDPLRRMAGMEAIVTEGEGVRLKLDNSPSLSQKEAAAISAKADVDTSIATAAAARELAEMNRMKELEFLDQQAQRAAAQAANDAFLHEVVGEGVRNSKDLLSTHDDIASEVNK